MKQTKFKTHQEIDDYYTTIGVDVAKLKREEVAVGIALDNSWNNARLFLKKKVGIFGYYFLAVINFKLIPNLEGDYWFEKEAKNRGWI